MDEAALASASCLAQRNHAHTSDLEGLAPPAAGASAFSQDNLASHSFLSACGGSVRADDSTQFAGVGGPMKARRVSCPAGGTMTGHTLDVNNPFVFKDEPASPPPLHTLFPSAAQYHQHQALGAAADSPSALRPPQPPSLFHASTRDVTHFFDSSSYSAAPPGGSGLHARRATNGSERDLPPRPPLLGVPGSLKRYASDTGAAAWGASAPAQGPCAQDISSLIALLSDGQVHSGDSAAGGFDRVAAAEHVHTPRTGRQLTVRRQSASGTLADGLQSAATPPGLTPHAACMAPRASDGGTTAQRVERTRSAVPREFAPPRPQAPAVSPQGAQTSSSGGNGGSAAKVGCGDGSGGCSDPPVKRQGGHARSLRGRLDSRDVPRSSFAQLLMECGATVGGSSSAREGDDTLSQLPVLESDSSYVASNVNVGRAPPSVAGSSARERGISGTSGEREADAALSDDPFGPPLTGQRAGTGAHLSTAQRSK